MKALYEREIGNHFLFTDYKRKFVSEVSQNGLVLSLEGQPNCDCITSAIQSLRCEKNEDRYVLIGCGDGKILIYDMEDVKDHSSGPLLSVGRGKGRHEKGISLAEWYCKDNGMFCAGKFDGSVGLWDTNEMKCVHLYKVSKGVNCIANGLRGENVSLIAVGTKSDYLRLIDIRQKANTHTLMGHREQVNTLQWSKTSPFLLCSGDKEGRIFLWDIRKSSPMMELGSSQKIPEIIAPIVRANYGLKKLKVDVSDKEVEKIIRRTSGTIKKQDKSAHQGTVNSMYFSPNGLYLFTFNFGDSLKVWDTQSFELLFETNNDGKLKWSSSHSFVRFDMVMSDNVFDDNEKIYIGSKLNMYAFSLKTSLFEFWPSLHNSSYFSTEYNSRLEEFYTSSQDGVFRIWNYSKNSNYPETMEIEQDQWSEE